MEDDPKKPYKAYVAAIVGGASVIVTEYADVVPTWVVVIAAVVAGGGATYFKKNPLKKRTQKTQPAGYYD